MRRLLDSSHPLDLMLLVVTMALRHFMVLISVFMIVKGCLWLLFQLIAMMAWEGYVTASPFHTGSVLFSAFSPAAARGASIGPTNFTTANLINYQGPEAGPDHSAVTTVPKLAAAAVGDAITVTCASHGTSGVFWSVGVVGLTPGEKFTWMKDEDGLGLFHCEFVWSSVAMHIDYEVDSTGRVPGTAVNWVVNEAGLFTQSGAGLYCKVTGWTLRG